LGSDSSKPTESGSISQGDDQAGGIKRKKAENAIIFQKASAETRSNLRDLNTGC
jgi:hypothetical protein